MTVDASRTRVELDEAELDDLAAKACEGPPSSLGYLELGARHTDALVGGTDWRAFDPGRLQDTLNQLTHIQVTLDGHLIHAVHAPGSSRTAAPLLLTHGWPSSFLEYVALLPLLPGSSSDSGSSDGDTSSVVVPSLPGFGFSGAPPEEGLSHGQVAEIWHRLMVDVFEYERYFAHGGDLGAGVTVRLARTHSEAVTAVHLATPGLAAPPEPWTEPVRRHLEEVAQSLLPYSNYQHNRHSALPADDPGPTPTAIDVFGGETVPFPNPPRDLAERYFKVVKWAEHDRGGHFPAVAEPRLLAECLQSAFRPYRDAD